MRIIVRDTLDRKYMHPGSVMIDPYTEEKEGYLYLVSDNPTQYCKRHAIRCDAIVDVVIA